MAHCGEKKKNIEEKSNISEVIWPRERSLSHVLHQYNSISVIMRNETLFTWVVFSLSINGIWFMQVQRICVSRHTMILTHTKKKKKIKILLADGVQQRPLLFQCEILQMFWAFSPDSHFSYSMWPGNNKKNENRGVSPYKNIFIT